MRYSENLHLNLPEDSDPLEISKLSENFETLDASVSSIRAPGTKIGDIVYSAQNLEEQSNGVWIACDQREVLVDEYPELCALPLMRKRYAAKYTAYPKPLDSPTISVGAPESNLKVGERYIPASMIKDANWNTSVAIYDLEDQKSIGNVSGTGVYYVDDNIVIYNYGSSTASYAILPDLNTRKTISAGVVFIMPFQDKYLFVGRSADANSQTPLFICKWILKSDLLNPSISANSYLHNCAYVTQTGFELCNLSPSDHLNLRNIDIPFGCIFTKFNEALYALNGVREIANTNRRYVGLFQSFDGITWTHVYTMPQMPDVSIYRNIMSLGVVADKLWIIQSYVTNVSNNYLRMTRVYALDQDLAAVETYDLEGVCMLNASGSVIIEGEYLYMQCQYTHDVTISHSHGNTPAFARRINLRTKEVSRLHMPPWVYYKEPANRNFANYVCPTLVWPEINMESTGSITGSSYNGTRGVSVYDFEKGLIASKGMATHAILDDPVNLIVNTAYNMPYNSEYIFILGQSTYLMCIKRDINTRVLPYIRNGYIKALNEGDVE